MVAPIVLEAQEVVVVGVLGVGVMVAAREALLCNEAQNTQKASYSWAA